MAFTLDNNRTWDNMVALMRSRHEMRNEIKLLITYEFHIFGNFNWTIQHLFKTLRLGVPLHRPKMRKSESCNRYLII